MARGGPYEDVRRTPVAGIDPEAETPGLPGQPNVFSESIGGFPSPDDGLPPIMANDRVPASPPAQPPAQPSQPSPQPSQVNVAEQDTLLDRAEDREERERRSRVRRGVSVEPGQFGWGVGSSDFYPAGFRPQESRSTQVGKYGGAPLYASTLAFPDAVIASRLQGLAQKKAAVEKELSKFDPSKVGGGVEDVVAPEYRDSFQQAYFDSLHNHMANTKEMWGEEEGLKRMMNANTHEGRTLREINSAWTTVARLHNQSTKAADAVIVGMDSGTLEKNPYLYEKAKELRHKTGEWAGIHDPKELARKMTVFTGVASLDDQVHKDGIVTLLRNAGNVHEIAERVKAGDDDYLAGFSTIRNLKSVDRKDVIEALTDRYYPQYKDYMSRGEMEKYFTSIAGGLSEEKLSQSRLSTGRGGGGTQANPAANYRVENTAVPEGTRNAFGEVAGSTDRKGGEPGFTGSYPTISLFGSTNKQAKLANPLTFRYGNREVFMYPERIMNINGTPFVVGKEGGMPRTAAERAAAAKSINISVEEYNNILDGPDTPEKGDLIQRFKVLGPVMVPMAGNEALIEGMGFDPDQITAGLKRREQPGFKDPTAADKAPPPRTALAEEWEKVKRAKPKWTAQQVTDHINKMYNIK